VIGIEEEVDEKDVEDCASLLGGRDRVSLLDMDREELERETAAVEREGKLTFYFCMGK
jgi:hypothetical protein